MLPGLPEEARDVSQVEAVEDRSVVKECAARSFLRIARDLQVAKGQVGGPPVPDGSDLSPFQAAGYAGEDGGIASRDVVEPGVWLECKHEGKVETPRPLKYGATSGDTPEDGNSLTSAGLDVDFFMELPGDAEGDKVRGTLPEA